MMNYPGHIVQQGDRSTAVTAVQQQLNKKGCGPLQADGDFGLRTFNAVQLFQARFANAQGHPLKVDGVVGPVTWSALFGMATVSPVTEAPNSLLAAVLNVARSNIGVMEVPPGSNNGHEVNIFQDAVNAPHGSAWCMAFVYWCFNQACVAAGRNNPLYKTGAVMEQWSRTTGTKILAANARINTGLVLPGQVFIIATGGGHGHTGFIEKVENGLLTTIEGNTNTSGSSEGTGVFRRIARTISSINEGFIQYS